MSGELYNGYPPPNPIFSGSTSGGPKKKESGAMPNKELHMFVWSSSASPVSEGNLRHAFNRATSTDFESSKAAHQQENVASRAMQELIENMSPAGKRGGGDKDVEILEEGSKFPTSGSPLSCQKKVNMEEGDVAKKQQMPPASVMTRLILIMAALPQGIVPFVFAKEYNVHPDILSTAVIFGMLIALPITILYYVLLGL
ncbi:hypothetical protein V6N12_038827 [Hibiscus sabdariffa]|uniref:Uncharacterized protein n=1 Tax=Hibiscus sabdariffa TaxID=183260 RepID=A0ABR2DYT6_9ROSI